MGRAGYALSGQAWVGLMEAPSPGVGVDRRGGAGEPASPGVLPLGSSMRPQGRGGPRWLRWGGEHLSPSGVGRLSSRRSPCQLLWTYSNITSCEFSHDKTMT